MKNEASVNAVSKHIIETTIKSLAGQQYGRNQKANFNYLYLLENKNTAALGSGEGDKSTQGEYLPLHGWIFPLIMSIL